MKNINKKKKNSIDPIAEARKSKKFQEYSKNAELRIRFAVEVYNARMDKHLSQQGLAKEIGSTQKVISKIENAEVNIGIELLNKLIEKLDLSVSVLAKIFERNSDSVYMYLPVQRINNLPYWSIESKDSEIDEHT